MDKQNIRDIYELTPMQKGILFHSLKDIEKNYYFVQGFANLEGIVDPNVLEKSLNTVIAKYDVLRTAFLYKNLKQPIQVVLKERSTTLLYKDITDYPEEEKKVFLEDYKKKDRNCNFDLSKDVLIRLHLIKTSSNKYELIWNFHHIIMDGWCWGILLEELLDAYAQSISNEPVFTNEKLTDYSSYIKWLKKQNHKEEADYWSSYLKGYEETVTIPHQSRGVEKEYRAHEYSFKINKNMSQGLLHLAKDMHTTINNVFQSAWGVLVQKYNRVEDVVFGSVVSGRPPQIKDVEKIVGLFINTVPVRVQAKEKESFRSLVRKVHTSSIESKAYEYSSLADIQANSDCHGSLIQHIVVFENYASSLETLKLKCEKVGFSLYEGDSFESNSYDLSIIVQPGEELEVSFAYNEEFYNEKFMQQLAGHFCQIITTILSNPDVQIKNINLLSSEEVTALANKVNGKEAVYPTQKTINSLFKEQVQKTPTNIALVHNGVTMTYQELDEKTNQLARYLLKIGVKSETIVALSVDRSIDMIISILSILKAGATYLPIDPQYPSERIDYTIRDSKAAILIVQNELQIPSNYEGEVVLLSSLEWENESNESLDERNTPSTMAYIIYTSGSTGKPKGVMVEHRNVVRLLFNSENIFDFNEKDCWTMFHSMCFDFSVWEMYGALLYGGKLVIVPLEVAKDARKFRALLLEEKVTILNQTPSAFNMLCSEERLHDNYLAIRNVIFGGEALSPIQLKDWKKKYSNSSLINMYGITETTVHVTYKVITDKEIENNISNIGRAIPTLDCYVLDQNMNLMPIGVPGELYVSGEGVTRGYLNREELTNERFTKNPFKPGKRMYKSGDLVKWNSNFEMEYLGRIDHQVKIRGHRIELDEVNTQLLLFEGVKEGAIVAKVDAIGYNYLCAYFVAKEEFDVAKLRRHMARALPEYMLPSYFIELDEMPITSNGKIKRDALPEPSEKRKTSKDHIEPKTELEISLLSIYQDVLGIEDISVNDHFFEMGGHSLKATMLVSRIQKELGYDIPIGEVFLNPSVIGMANFIESSNKYTTNAIEIEKIPPKETYPVSSQQKRIYSIHQYDDTGISYNIPFAFEIEGSVDKTKLDVAFHNLIERHESLRTAFFMKSGELVQEVQDDWESQLQYLTIQEVDLQKGLNSLIRPFDLEKAPLIRASLIEVNEKRQILFFDVHHIICDGLSINILMQDLLSIYQEQTLPLVPLQYKDYASWQQKWNGTDDFRKQENFWLSRFASESPVMEFPTDYARPPIQTFEGTNIEFEINKETTAKLKKLAVTYRATLYMTLLSAYNIFLSKYSGEREIVVGSPLSGRPTSQLNYTVGMFANVVPLKSTLSYEQTFVNYLQNVKDELIEVYQHGDYPLELLLEKTSVKRDLSRNPLFDSMFILQDNSQNELEVPGLIFKEFKMKETSAKLDFTWEVHTGDKLTINLCYNSRLFKKETIERMIAHFKQILLKLIENPNILVSDIDMLLDHEKHQILKTFNEGEHGKDLKDTTILHLFEERVNLTPDAIAASWKQESLTYRELSSKSNQLANLLKEKGIGKNDVVAIMLPSSLNMIIGIMGILKAGGTYLPIDPTYPNERIKYFLDDSDAQLLITVSEQEIAHSFTKDFLFINEEMLMEQDGSYALNISEPEDIAYLIYTSGSTGKPKGVMIQHNSLANLTLIASNLGIKEKTNVLQFSSFSFDASVWEIFPTLIAGGTLHIEEKEYLLEYGLSQWMEENKINVATLPPSVLRTIEVAKLPYLQTIVTAGEACTADIVNKWSKGRKLINAYGPTESTVCATLTFLSPNSNNITIGRPIMNTQVYVVNECNQLQPVGVPGELCIGGHGLAKGYYNRQKLTAEKFIENPFQPNSKIYKTGDLARWLPNGEIEYLGRIDHQVKIRGHRIEIGEVNECLLQHEEIQEAFILPFSREATNISLVAYYVAHSECSIQSLRAYMSKQLPEYMIPFNFIRLPELPLTSNGKVDRNALPKPKSQTENGIQPRNKKEQLLKKLWQEVLEIKEFGIEHSFFELGGDSIKAIQIVAKLKQMDYKLKIKDIFKYPSIMNLSSRLEKQIFTEDQVIEGPVPFTPIQQWVYELRENPNHWNQAIMLENHNGWEVEVVKRAFEIITSHHDALRMVFREKGSIVEQINLPLGQSHFDIEVFDFLNEQNVREGIEREANRLQRDINLEKGPLTKIGLFKTNLGDHLLIIINHLVIDAVSWRIILEDFEYLYKAIGSGQPIKLPRKTTSFKEWSYALIKYSSGEEFLAKKSYWENLMEDNVPNLPADLGRTDKIPHQFADMNEINTVITKEVTQQLLKEAPAAYGTEVNDLLLAAFTKTIKDWTGNNKVAIDLESHGRQELFPEIDTTRTVGWFTASYPVIYTLDENDFESIIKNVVNIHREVPNKGIGYGILKFLLNSEIKQGQNKKGLKPEILFNYLGQFQDGLQEETMPSSDMPVGDLINQDMPWPYNLEFNGFVLDGVLHYTIRYNFNIFSRETIEEITKAFQKNIVTLVEHCLNKNLQIV
ncbi:amino acid adenylation domain-containing protein [Priestia aryabhattai]